MGNGLLCGVQTISLKRIAGVRLREDLLIAKDFLSLKKLPTGNLCYHIQRLDSVYL